MTEATRHEIEDFYRQNLEQFKVISSGKEATALCPFHNDENPSFSVKLDPGLWFCHAGCGGGNMLTFADKSDISRATVPGYSDLTPHRRGVRGNKFQPMEIVDELRASNHYIATPINTEGTGDRLLVYSDGVFQPNGGEVARSEIHRLLGNEARKEKADAVIECLKESVKTRFEDTNPDAMRLINTKSGMIDWASGKTLPHSPEHLSTFQISAIYAPDVKAPALDRFLASILDQASISLLEEFVGYSMIPDTSYQKALILLGQGANGKSTLIDAITALFGEDNVSGVSLQELSRHRFKAADIHGKLLNVYSDLPRSSIEDTDLFKMIVSGDAITAERKWGHAFKFKPFARMLFSANKLPPTKDDSLAFFRRLLIIPFERTFEGNDAVPNLKRDLITTWAKSALLNRAIAGLNRLKKRGHFLVPARSQAMLDGYREDADDVYGFLKEAVEKADGGKVPKDELYQTYKFSRDLEDEKPVRQKDFNSRVTELYGAVEIKAGTRRTWRGIRLKKR